MLLRRLTDAEIEKLVDEQQADDTWHAHRDTYARFAHDVYGPDAAILSLGLGLVYNDEDYDREVGGVAVYDAEARPLDPDPTTAWWRAIQDDPPQIGALDYSESTDEDDAIARYAQALPAPAGTQRTFMLSRPPRRTLYPVYIPLAGTRGGILARAYARVGGSAD